MIKKIRHHVSRGWKAGSDSLGSAIHQAPPHIRKTAKRFLLGCVLILIVVVSVKTFLVRREAARRAAEIAAGPQVKVVVLVPSPGEHTVTLIGETRPYQEATLYAKVSGYLKTVKVDKGDAVKEGQVLAIIESPETDQGYAAALADSRNKLAIQVRMNTLFAKHLVSEQEADQVRADAEVSTARLHTEEILKGYETVRAPFKGTVTARFADPGALVQNATNSQTSALPIVTVSTLDRLRVDVFVDQHDAPYVEKNAPIEISLADRPEFKLSGFVSRISGELDPRTKMLLTEIDIPNDKAELVAGSFVNVALRIKAPPYVQAPIESLLMKGEKSYLTVVTPENLITLKAVDVATNDGKLLWISSGVTAGERVALSISDTVPEGGKVRPILEKLEDKLAIKTGEKKP